MMKSFKILAIVGFITLGTFFLFNNKVNALGPTIPDGDFWRNAGGGTGDGRIIVSMFGLDNTINSPTSTVKLFFNSPNAQVRIHNASFCGFPPDGINRSITNYVVFRADQNENAEFYSLGSAVANPYVYCGSDLVLNISGMQQSTYPGHQGKYVAYLVAGIVPVCGQFDPGCEYGPWVGGFPTHGAVNAFSITAVGGTSSFHAQNSDTFTSSNPISSSGTNGMISVQDRAPYSGPPNNTRYSWNFKFAPNCTIDDFGGTRTGYLKWGNLEQASLNSPINAWFELRTYDRKTGNFISSSSYTPPNNNDPFAVQTRAFAVNKNHKYEWIWHDLQRNNALQIWMPFDSAEFNFVCDRPPVGRVNSANCNMIYGWAIDPDSPVVNGVTPHPVRIHVYADGPAGSGTRIRDIVANTQTDSETGNLLNVNGNYGFKIDISDYGDAYSRQFYLYAIGIDENGNQNSVIAQLLGSPVTVGPCVEPTCSATPVDFVTGQPINPEVGQYFKINLAISYAPKTNGRPLKIPTAYVNVRYPGSPSATTPENFQFSYDIPGQSNQPPNHYFTGGSGYKSDVAGIHSVDGRVISNSIYGNVDIPCGNTVRITQHPYLKVYGNDVRAGGKFGDNCTEPLDENATILTRSVFGNDGHQYFAGSSVELAAYALAEIDQFYSASMNNPHSIAGVDATPQNGLTFSNWPADGSSPRGFNGVTDADKVGGTQGQTTGYGGESNMWRCIPDYWSYAPTTASNSVAVSATTGGVVKHSAPRVTVNGGVLTNGTKRTIFIEGDAYIDSPIEYTNVARSGINQIPQFTLVVKGNIYVGQNVGRLDGLFIALPRDNDNPSSSGGKIYTCAKNDGSLFGASELFDACQSKLTVNGAFIAKQIKFLRTRGSVQKALSPSQQLDLSFHDTLASANSSGKECVNIAESTNDSTWNDNYICVGPGQIAAFGLSWVNNGPTFPLMTYSPAPYGTGFQDALDRNSNSVQPGKICTPFFEPSELNTHNNNYLCYTDRGVILSFHYVGSGRPPVNGYRCDEFTGVANGFWHGTNDPHTWRDNALCQNILQPADNNEPATSDNIAEVFNFSPEMYLAVPAGFPVTSGSSSGTYDSIKTLPPLL